MGAAKQMNTNKKDICFAMKIKFIRRVPREGIWEGSVD